MPNGIPKARVEMPQSGKQNTASRIGAQTITNKFWKLAIPGTLPVFAAMPSILVSHAESLIFYFLFFLCSQTSLSHLHPSTIGYSFSHTFQTFILFLWFCIPCYHKMGNSAKILLSLSFDSTLVFHLRVFLNEDCMFKWRVICILQEVYKWDMGSK